MGEKEQKKKEPPFLPEPTWNAKCCTAAPLVIILWIEPLAPLPTRHVSLSDQNMATFTDRNNPFLSQTIDHQQQTMQPLDSLVAELPLHSPSAEKARSATSEYRWTINPLFSQQASFDTDSSDT